MNEFRIGFLRPAPRRRIELIGEDAHGDREGDAFRREKGKLALPIQTSRRDRRVRQPVERDVVDDVLARKALNFSVKYARDELVAALVVIKHPRGEAEGR